MFGLDYRYQLTWDRYVREGDKAVIYVGSPIAGFVGTCVVGPKHEAGEYIGWTKGRTPYLYRYRFKLDDLILADTPIRIRYTCSGGPDDRPRVLDPGGFLNNVVFIADKSATWNQYLQVSIIALTEEDYAGIARKFDTTCLMP